MHGPIAKEDEYTALINDTLNALSIEEAIDKLHEIIELVLDAGSYIGRLAEESSKVIHAELAEQTRAVHSSGRWPHMQLTVDDDNIRVEYSSGFNHMGANLCTRNLAGSLSFPRGSDFEDKSFKKKNRCFLDYLLDTYPEIRERSKTNNFFWSSTIHGNYTYLYGEFLKTLDMIETICTMSVDAN